MISAPLCRHTRARVWLGPESGLSPPRLREREMGSFAEGERLPAARSFEDVRPKPSRASEGAARLLNVQASSRR